MVTHIEAFKPAVTTTNSLLAPIVLPMPPTPRVERKS
jgi:hypothetical protein